MLDSQGRYLNADEVVAYLKRTSQVTALVEGTDDYKVYRYIENRLSDIDVDVMICEGRSGLLSVFSRKNEFYGAPVIFIADQDMWYFTGIPGDLSSEIVFSSGYSIENDLYVRDVFEGLMSHEERSKFSKLVQCAASWQAFHVEEYVRNGNCSCDVHVNVFAPGDELCVAHLASIGFVAPSADLISRIVSSYPQSLRGKTLFQLLLRILSATNRSSKYSRENLIEMGAKFSNPLMESLCERTRIAVTKTGASTI